MNSTPQVEEGRRKRGRQVGWISPVPLVDRLMARVEFDTAAGCWLWTGTLSHNGYARFKPSGQTSKPVHRLTYELVCQAVPAGLQLDHKCRVRCCVNPEHLEPVTRLENIARGNAPHMVNARKTHCKHGHEFTPENTGRHAKRGSRYCKTCLRAHAARYARSPDRRPRVGHHQLRKTHCPQGHPYEGENLMVWRGQRKCRTCATALWRSRSKAGKPPESLPQILTGGGE